MLFDSELQKILQFGAKQSASGLYRCNYAEITEGCDVYLTRGMLELAPGGFTDPPRDKRVSDGPRAVYLQMYPYVAQRKVPRLFE